MKGLYGYARTTLGHLVGCLTGTTLLVIFLVPAAAHADGRFRWQNSWNGFYLEILYSSHADGADAITYPLNVSSANQIWQDRILSDGYYVLQNGNSGSVLDRWDYGHINSIPGATGPTCSRGMQWQWTNQTWQHWGYRTAWSDSERRSYILWINKYGCAGNAYHDVLSVPLLGYPGQQATQTTLYPEDYCSDQRYGPPAMCWWKRNGQ